METQVIKHLKEIIDKEREIINKEKEIIIKETNLIEDLEGVLKSKIQTITLTVEASKLYGLKYPPNQTDVDELCLLEDVLHDSSENTPLSDFKSHVYINRNVMWAGGTKNPNGIDKGYSVSIEKIHYEKNKPGNEKNFFDSDYILGKPPTSKSKIVTTVVRDDKTLEDLCYVYSIHFRIDEPNGKGKDYVIDPKLCCNT